MSTPNAAPASQPRGQIHDLGYKRYAGARQAHGTRWRVIMRQQVSMAWKTWWRFKAWMGMAVIITMIAGAFMYFATNKIARAIPGNVIVTLADATLPLSIAWFCRAGFMLSLTIGATVIAGDVQSGAFTFYFARSVEPRDYLLGKLAGLAVLMGIVTAAGPVLLALMRLGLCDSTDDLIAHLTLVPKALCVGLLSTIAYSAVPLAASALASRKRTALALWAAYYLIVGNMAFGIGLGTKTAWLAALDLSTAVSAVGFKLFHIPAMFNTGLDISVATGVASILVQAAGAITIAAITIRSSAKAGIGGAS